MRDLHGDCFCSLTPTGDFHSFAEEGRCHQCAKHVPVEGADQMGCRSRSVPKMMGLQKGDLATRCRL